MIRSMSAFPSQVRTLTMAQRDQMYDIFEGCYSNTSRAQFDQDLDEKIWVVLLADSTGRVHGFSTMCFVRTIVGATPVIGLFSGDTALRREHWGDPTWHRAWLQHVIDLADMERIKHPDAKLYWFELTSTYKTYRLIPMAFRNFCPSYHGHALAFDRAALEALAKHKFPTQYSASQGVVRLSAPTPVRAGVADVREKHRRNPHVEFFLTANPGHADGDLLVCLAELSVDNLTPLARRILGNGPRISAHEVPEDRELSQVRLR
jgi:hypothetical protein